MIKKTTIRIGTIKDEVDAARIYDVLAIIADGLMVRTYFISFLLGKNKFRLYS